MEEKKQTKPHTGTISVSWAECPNVDCDSRAWAVWDVIFDGDRFQCGTCSTPLGRPIFVCPIKIKN